MNARQVNARPDLLVACLTCHKMYMHACAWTVRMDYNHYGMSGFAGWLDIPSASLPAQNERLPQESKVPHAVQNSDAVKASETERV